MAQTTIGNFYKLGNMGLNQDYDESFYCYKIVADKDHPEAVYQLAGYIYKRNAIYKTHCLCY